MATNSNSEMGKIIEDIKKCDMLKNIEIKKLVDVDDGYAYVIAKNLVCKKSENLNTNQLRKFFTVIRKIEQKEKWVDVKSDFYLLKPRIAVSVGRGNVPKPFFDLIIACMNKVDVGSEEEKMDNLDIFIEFFEAIVAYHKYFENLKEDKKREKRRNRR